MEAEEFPLPIWPTNLFIGLTFLYIITISSGENTFFPLLEKHLPKGTEEGKSGTTQHLGKA